MAESHTPHLKALKRGEALVYCVDGTVEHQGDGSWRTNIDELQQLIGCRSFQMIPCTQGWLSHKFELWMDEEGACVGGNFNAVASTLFGEQVYGGALHGRVLVVRRGTIK